MRLKEVNYFGFDHSKINTKFSGDLTYIRTFTIRGRHWAVYKAANPNRDLGHKDYMMLTHDAFSDKWYVSGSTPEEMDIERIQEAVLCTACDTVIYSINRHHFHHCGCDNHTMVDGGKDYVRHGGKNMKLQEIVKIDLVDGTLVEKNGIKLDVPLKLDYYRSENENPEAVPPKKRAKASHRSEKKKPLTTRRKTGKVEKNPRSKNNG